MNEDPYRSIIEATTRPLPHAAEPPPGEPLSSPRPSFDRLRTSSSLPSEGREGGGVPPLPPRREEEAGGGIPPFSRREGEAEGGIPPFPPREGGAGGVRSNSDAIATPIKPLPVIVQPVPGRLGPGTKLAIGASLVCSLLALAFSGAMLFAALLARNAAVAGLDNAIGQIEGLCGPNPAPIVFPFSQTIRFKGNVALPDKMVIPFKGVIPIQTVVRISIAGLPGSPTVEVPINTTVPVDTQVPIPAGIAIPIDTSIPVNQQIPIDLCAQGGPARELLARAADELKALRKAMMFP